MMPIKLLLIIIGVLILISMIMFIIGCIAGIRVKLALWCVGMIAMLAIGLFSDNMFLCYILTLMLIGLSLNIAYSLYHEKEEKDAKNQDLEGPI